VKGSALYDQTLSQIQNIQHDAGERIICRSKYKLVKPLLLWHQIKCCTPRQEAPDCLFRVKNSLVDNARTRTTCNATQRTTRNARTQRVSTRSTHATHARARGRVSTCKPRFGSGWKAKRTPWSWPRSFGLDDAGAPYHGRQMRTWSELGRQERVHVGRQVHFEEQETPGRIQSSCPCPDFFRRKWQAMHLGAHVYDRLVPCLSWPIWH
jgi:hypothetical protein